MSKNSRRVTALLVCVVLAGCITAFGRSEPPAGPPAATATPDDGVPAVLKGKYGQLLRKINAPDDLKTYGEFNDWGSWSGTSYAGFNDLPPGYWVYVHPNWYIFGEKPDAKVKRPWGPEQATGAPDTKSFGDIPTSWASKTADGQQEWLELKYDSAVHPLAILVYETWNPGAACRVTTWDAKGNEIELWKGDDPTPTDRNKGISVIPFQTDCTIDRVRIYLDSVRVKGWNEIDAVGLLDTDGVTQWAVNAEASSTWAE